MVRCAASRTFAVVCGLLMLSCPCGQAKDKAASDLPAWSKEDWQADPNDVSRRLGGLLWPGSDPSLDDARLYSLPGLGSDAVDSPSRTQPAADISGFLPPLPVSPRGMDRATPPKGSLVDAGPDFLNALYESDPSQYLMDPGYQLSEIEREDIERFLAYHARDAQIDAHVIILGAEQVLGSQIDWNRVAQGGIIKDNTCVLILPLGDVRRARLFFTGNIHRDTTPLQLQAVLADCVASSSRLEAAYEQLHRFLVRLSIRLFWLENVLRRPLPAPGPKETAATPAKPQAKPVEKPAIALAEVPPVEEPAPAGLSITPAVGFGGLAGLAACVWFVRSRWRRYKLRHFEWLLPDDLPVPAPRLGGVHCGGAGAWIQFNSP